MRRKLALPLLLVLALLIAPSCAPTPTPGAPTKVKLAMGSIPNVQFAPVYVALHKGYFAAEGLELELDYGMEADIITLLGTGKLEFAIGSGDQVILARAQGLPVVYVYNWYNRFPVSIVALEKSGIREPKDLIGKRIGIPALHGASYIGLRALFEATGIPESSVQLQAIGYTQVAALTNGLVDAAVCYYMNEPVQLQLAGERITQILVADYVSLPTNGILTSEEVIKAKPEVVQRLCRAFHKGLLDTLARPDEAFAIAKEFVPEIAQNEAAQRAVLDAAVQLWSSEHPGQSDPTVWQQAVEFMARAGLLAQKVDIESMVTNRFVPQE